MTHLMRRLKHRSTPEKWLGTSGKHRFIRSASGTILYEGSYFAVSDVPVSMLR